MRPLLFNASHILNAPPPCVAEIRGRRIVCRLYDDPAPNRLAALLTRFRLAHAVFRGKYDAVLWETPTPEALKETAALYSRIGAAGE